MWANLVVETLSNTTSQISNASSHLANASNYLANNSSQAETAPGLSGYLTFSNIISITALALSLISIYYTRGMYKIREIQEIDRKQEMRKANLTAQLIMKTHEKDSSADYSLRITNIGKARAKDISILIDDKPIDKYPPVYYTFAMYGQTPGKSILTNLSGGDSWSIPLNYRVGIPASFDIKITWSDDSEVAQHYEQHLLPVIE
jgi:hypothetical protein